MKELAEPPKFRLPENMSLPDYFVPGGREKEIKVLKESMLRGENPMLWGYGGIGKTETAIELARRMDTGKGAYLVHFKNSMRETILSMNFSGYRFKTDQKGIALEEREELEYQERLNLLKDYYEDSILIVDNFDNDEKTLDELRREKEFKDIIGLKLKLIFTTRYPVGRKDWEITELDKEALLNIMKFYLKSVPVPPEEKLYELVEAAGSHTLTVVLMAKTLEKSWGMVTPDTMLEAFKNASVSENSFPEVVSDQNREYKQEQISQHLKLLFNLSDMSEEEKKVLSCAVLLPQGGMDALLFMECLEKEEQKCLQRLVAKGWLRRQANNLLTIHPIIRQVCREELKPDDEVCQGFLDALWVKYDKNQFSFIRYFQMAECFALATEYMKDEKGLYSTRTGTLYDSIYDYKKGIEYYQRAKRTLEKNLSPMHPDLASLYNNMGFACGKLGVLEMQLEYHQKAMKILEQNMPSMRLELVATYTNIGCIYEKFGAFGEDFEKASEKAVEYNKKALEIQKENLMLSQPVPAVTDNNIGVVYGDLGEYEKKLEDYQKLIKFMEDSQMQNKLEMVETVGWELEYYQRAIGIRKDSLSLTNLELAKTYDYLGYVYGIVSEYEKQLEYCQRAVRIFEENLLCMELLDFDIRFSNIYKNLGDAYGNMGEQEKKREYYQKSEEYTRDVIDQLLDAWRECN